MAGFISKGIKLSYKNGSGTTGTYTALTNLQEIPDLGGTTDTIEVTTLEDSAHVYASGLKNYGDSLDFKFLYEAAQFKTLNGLSGIQNWKVELPGELGSCTFSGTCSVKLDGVGVNAALTYTLSIRPNTAMLWAE
jgi:hypothetical protein